MRRVRGVREGGERECKLTSTSLTDGSGGSSGKSGSGM